MGKRKKELDKKKEREIGKERERVRWEDDKISWGKRWNKKERLEYRLRKRDLEKRKRERERVVDMTMERKKIGKESEW